MVARLNLSPKPLTHLTDDAGAERPCHILYVTGAKDEFDIFRQYLKESLNCILYQAETIALAKQIISNKKLDVIFIDHLLSDAPGLDLLADLHRREFDIPIIFTLNQAHVKIGAKAIVQGAHNFFIKEKLSTQNIQAIIWETLESARLSKGIKDARDRIVLVSIRDHLTRLYNRQFFDQTLNTEMDKARRYQFPLSILMVDFDKFKTLNQAHGYETGDQALRTSAALIKGMVRNMDMVCRYGGDEFGILLPNTGLEGAQILARRILKAIRSHGLEINGTPFPLTVSIGIASHTDTAPYQDQSQNQDLVKLAIKAADLASQQGGNTIQHLTTSVSPHV
jgi:diguanylate cyclase (GGDEF)-like protein